MRFTLPLAVLVVVEEEEAESGAGGEGGGAKRGAAPPDAGTPAGVTEATDEVAAIEVADEVDALGVEEVGVEVARSRFGTVTELVERDVLVTTEDVVRSCERFNGKEPIKAAALELAANTTGSLVGIVAVTRMEPESGAGSGGSFIRATA
jgi:hypothetical protein